MASYGSIYEFVYDSENGSNVRIVIRKKDQEGGIPIRRPLGRAPVLKRENNDCIFGTSLELYAECKVDGEYAQFYTSSADEFRVEVWRSEILIWVGFISPELYSEPDVAPPYDVQIIATDGLGELKNYTFNSTGPRTIYEHLKSMLDHVELARPYGLVSDLRCSDGDTMTDPVDLFSIRVDLEHELGENCYDVLQRLLASINAGMTLFEDKWLIFRETDFIRMAGGDWISGVSNNGLETIYRIEDFGSMDTADWWPIGQMATSIEPAKKSFVLESPNNYKTNAFSSNWALGNAARYDEDEGAYILPDEGSYIMQSLDFGEDEVGYRLALRVSARNVGSTDEDQPIGIRVKINSHTASGYYDMWLVRVQNSDRGPGDFYWRSDEDWIDGELAVPADSDVSSDAQDIDIIIPLYDARLQGFNTRSWIYAASIEVTVFNPAGTHDIYVYGVSLNKYDQFEGYQANVSLANNSREAASNVTFSFSDGSRAPTAGYKFMSGLPLFPGTNNEILTWSIGQGKRQDYLSMMSEDYAMAVALPRMQYRGKLNVPLRTIPLLFRRDNTLYFPRTYSYDLYNDEIDVELISIPAAEVASTSVVVSQMTQSEGSFSSAGSGGGSGVGSGVDLSGYAKKEEVLALSELLASMWTVNESGNLVTDKQVIIKNNLIVNGDTASGGDGQNTVVGITGILVGNSIYKDLDSDGLIDLTKAFEGLSVDVDLSNYYTKQEVDSKIARIDLSPYAKKTELEALQNEVNAIESMLGTDAKDTIDTWNEVVAFLDGYKDSDDLATILSSMNGKIDTLSNALAGYLPLSGGTLNGALTVNGAISGASTIQANSVICGTTRLRVNSPTSAGIFAFMDARQHSSGSNRSTAHIGSAYGNVWDIANISGMVAISIYKGCVGIGREFTDAELKAASDGSVGLTVAGNLVVNGDIASA